ncbi:Pfs, NACHT and Ankyrin domain protein [Beauveria bassiana ARSEF 2860]|uniref:Pfs, NACHT and Ankyrin domain protein n=1 Tax=Beauveria bassiana (strain ARSEF 2860) TaxID=655819 RepID=J4VTW4_BEAB2|nr:Pfs, NACHT and Ankyrin domain protein [Beauveria bassiana ARSEF 2860]EJP61980.1 Pfs, NACHT and Ankyrin domain protein [Beauveria bassiana ARSEF 2860]
MDTQRGDEKRDLDHDSYTVGWICVLRSVLNASRALLDEVHQPLPPAEKDDNSYLLGRMAGHNVVIAFDLEQDFGKGDRVHDGPTGDMLKQERLAYDAQPRGSIKTNQQYRKAMGLPQRYNLKQW